MLTIWKEEIGIEDTVNLLLPLGAEILSCQVQHDTPCIWYKCDSVQSREPRTLRMFGTGHPIPEGLDLKFIDTIQVLGGTLIFHVFELVTGNKDERPAEG